jgi:hypothetical protein
VERIEYANDLNTISTRGPLTAVRYLHTATGNTNYGWHGIVRAPAAVTSVTRIDYNNDSVATSNRGSLTAARYGAAAAGGFPG